MAIYNTQIHFLYRQFFLTPTPLSPSVSLAGKTGLITGANTGLGYSAAHQLLSNGLSHLILAVRNVSKGETARQKLLASLPPTITSAPEIEVWEVDLAKYASIVSFAERVKKSNIVLDFAVLNAGVVQFDIEVNQATGNEQSIQINWLSTALLTLLLLPILDNQAFTHPERERPVLSIVGSETAAWAQFKEAPIALKSGKTLLDTLNENKGFEGTERYYTSKLLYQLFFIELNSNHRSAASREKGTVLNLVNPGFCYGTELHRGAEGILGRVVATLKRVIGRSVPVGARTLVHGAVSAGVESDGQYLTDCRVGPFAGYGDSEAGKKVQGKVWEETVGEVSKVVDVKQLLSEL
ncbi:hypothetical protein BJY04DRAFT_96259 [Aspergillus karnatakaensis]|uniref:uncharacterized protein n=1 Tax=Aspergillus karnatakaensis TaxID=1810916 RepID=UPI003CCDAD86